MSAKPQHQPGEAMLSDKDLVASLSGDVFLEEVNKVGVQSYLGRLANFFKVNFDIQDEKRRFFVSKKIVNSLKHGNPEETMVVQIYKAPDGAYKEGDIAIILTLENGRQYILDMIYGKPFSFSDGQEIQDVDTAGRGVGGIGRQALTNMRLFLESYTRGRESGQHQTPDRVAELLQ